MTASCLYCHSRLGSNSVVEHLPLGRRLAYDPARGRLWVVCLRCYYWNLTPLERRWEAIEESELLFEQTHRVISSGQIALARVADRLTLIRIGTPTRGEFAAWRYGNRLTARRKARLLKVGTGVLTAGAIAVAGAAAGVGLGFTLYGFLYWAAMAEKSSSPVVATIPRLHHDSHLLTRTDLGFLTVRKPSRQPWHVALHDMRLDDGEAVMALGLTLPLINRFGGRPRDVDEAIRLLAASDPRAFMAEAAGYNSNVVRLPRVVRVALEMAAHEDAEQAAASGELALLERAWREAEGVAAIADSLLIPASVHNALLRLRSRRGGPREA